jgi:hypothetical protein
MEFEYEGFLAGMLYVVCETVATQPDIKFVSLNSVPAGYNARHRAQYFQFPGKCS